jgi:cyanophycinase-like exopeptidase
LSWSDQAPKNREAIGAAEERIAGALRVGHQAEDIAGFVSDSRDVFPRSVGIGLIRCPALGIAVAEDDLAVEAEAGECLVVGKVATFTVRNGDIQNLPGPCAVRERRIVLLNANRNVLANKVEAAIANQRARQ